MNLRKLVLFISFLALFSTAACAYFYLSAATRLAYQQLNKEIELQLRSFAMHFSTHIEHYQKDARLLAGMDAIKRVILDRDKDALSAAIACLDNSRKALDANCCHLLDRSGMTIAASNNDTASGHGEKDFASCLFFKQAIDGRPGVFLGRCESSGNIGIFYSHPVFLDGEPTPAGVVFIKATLEHLCIEKEEVKHGFLAVVDPGGIVFISKWGDRLFKSLWKPLSNGPGGMTQSRHHDSRLESWTGFIRKDMDRAVDQTGKAFHIHKHSIDLAPGWSFFLFHDVLDEPVAFLNPLLKTAGAAVLILCLTTGFTVMFLYRRASRDILARKQADDALKHSLDRWRSLVETTSDWIWEVDCNGVYIYASPKVQDLLGYEPQELIGRTCFELMTDDEARRVGVLFREIVQSRTSFKNLENTCVHKDGRLVVIESSGNPFLGPDGSLAGYRGVDRDITRRKSAEDEIRKSETKFRTYIDKSPAGFFVADSEGRFIEVNQTACRMTGYSEEELKRLRIVDLAPEGSWEARELFRIVSSWGKASGEEEYVRKDGTRGWWIVDAVRLSGDRIMGFTTDITERKRIERALHTSEEKYRRLFEEARDGIFVADAETGVIVDCNLEAARLVGREKSGLIGMHQKVLHPPAGGNGYYTETFEEHRDADDGQILEGQVITGSGEIRSVAIKANVFFADGRKYIQGIFRDVTEQKQAQEEKSRLETRLRQAQKMEAIGTLAGGIAHDFNNILGIIMGFSEMARDDIPKGSRARSDLEQVITASLRARDLVKQILAFSRQTEKMREPVQIGIVIKEAIRLLAGSIPASVEIRQNISNDCGSVMADPTQIHQVLINLCTNAVQAMREKGVLEITLSEAAQDEDTIDPSRPVPARYVKLSVSDTGPGMEQETLGRIFDPFFTTKEPGKGTGLGLSVVYGIVESHGGRITVETEPGKGSVFNVFFPVTEITPEQNREITEDLPAGNEHILFVDDELMITDLGKNLLEGLGYRVTTATSSTEALTLFKASPYQYDMVITDQAMPGLTGDDLARNILALRPGMPVILCTGYSTIIDSETARGIGIRAFLLKPVSKARLARTIRDILDQKGD